MRSVLVAIALMSVTGQVAEQRAAAGSPRVRPGDELKVSVTAYCLDGTTKSGVPTRRGIVAADENVLPLGSIVRLDGLSGNHDGVYQVMDTGPAINGREIDLFMPNCRAAVRFGRQTARLSVLRVHTSSSRHTRRPEL